MLTYAHLNKHLQIEFQIDPGNTIVDSLLLLRGVCTTLRNFIKVHRHSPEISYQLFLKHTRKKCAIEIRHAINTRPLKDFSLATRASTVGNGPEWLVKELLSIAQSEVEFYQLDNEWAENMLKISGIKNPSLFAMSFAILSSYKYSDYYTQIYRVYADNPIAIARVQAYIRDKVSKLVNKLLSGL